MNSEMGLMIIWNKARSYQDEIINDVKKRFTIRNIFEIEWNKELFSDNLTRFYGENLPKNSFKEKHCGNGPFLLLILEDNNPIYNYRPTSHGKMMVNVNFFDSKELYRSFAGQHRIHATNDKTEFRHDLMLLLGLNYEDCLKKYEPSDDIIKLKQDIIGFNGWTDLKKIFYVLNETVDYVVLRNFELLPNQYELGIHSDIDILCSSKENIAKILNAKPYYKNKSRAKYIVNVANLYINFDLRYISDNYYDKLWEKEILNTKVIYNNIYVPNDLNYKYSLIYHALIQKKKIANDYKKKIGSDEEKLFNDLDKFMKTNNYEYTYPIDFSVYFNDKYLDKKINLSRKLYFKYYKFFKIFERR